MAKSKNIWEAFYVWRASGEVIFVGSFPSQPKASQAARFMEHKLGNGCFGAARLIYQNGKYRNSISYPGGTPHNIPLCCQFVEGRELYKSPARIEHRSKAS